jgi:amino acid transporter
MSESTGSKRYLVGGGAAACAVCCAPPLLALIGIAGVGTVATLATLAFAGIVFALVVAAASVLTYMARKRHRDKEFAMRGSGHDDRALPDPVRRSSTP